MAIIQATIMCIGVYQHYVPLRREGLSFDILVVVEDMALMGEHLIIRICTTSFILVIFQILPCHSFLRLYSYDQENQTLDGVTTFSSDSQVVVGKEGNFILPKNDRIVSDCIRLFGNYEKPSIDLVKSILTTDAVVLDVGANVGAWSVPLSKYVGGGGSVYAFEPQRKMLLHLSSTILLNNINNIFPIHAVVTNSSNPSFSSISEFDDQRNERINFGGVSVKKMRKSCGINCQKVRNVVLDELFLDGVFPCPQFLKLDVERHELLVLLGTQKLLLECHPIIFFEASCPYLLKSIFTLLDWLGYVFAWVIAPVSDDAEHFGRKPSYSNIPPELIGHIVYGSTNVLAVPKDRASLLEARSGLFPVRFSEGLHTIDEHNISYCVQHDGETKCLRFEHLVEDVEEGHCEGEEISAFERDYWKRFL